MNDLSREISEAIDIPDDEIILESLNANLIDVKALVRTIRDSRLGIHPHATIPLLLYSIFYPAALLLLTDRHLIVAMRKKRYEPPYGTYIDVSKVIYDDILEPIDEERPLSIVARIDGELRVFHFFQFFEVDTKKPGIGTRGEPIPSGDFIRMLYAVRERPGESPLS